MLARVNIILSALVCVKNYLGAQNPHLAIDLEA